jgi:Homeodomain-like domain
MSALADRRGFRGYVRSMRYAQGGGLTAEGRRRRELVRLAAVERFERCAAVADIAAELRVSERSVQRWRRAWQAPGLASKGQAARCRLSGDQLAELDHVLDAGPAAAGWEDQRWTLASSPAGHRCPAASTNSPELREISRSSRAIFSACSAICAFSSAFSARSRAFASCSAATTSGASGLSRTPLLHHSTPTLLSSVITSTPSASPAPHSIRARQREPDVCRAGRHLR